MDQMTYEQVLASIDRERAAAVVANLLAYHGGNTEWDYEFFDGVTEALASLIPEGAPHIGADEDGALKFWGTIALDRGIATDYDPDEPDEDETVTATLVIEPSTWRYLMQQEVRADGQRPWPIAVDQDMVVVSGLGEDDGARLIGFQEPGVQTVVLLATAWVQGDLDAAKGLEPVFSNGNLFVMQGPIEAVSQR